MSTLVSKFKFNLPDYTFIISVVGLIGFGFMALMTASGGGYFLKQFIFLAVSLGIVLFFYLFDISIYKQNAPIIYGLNLILLFVVKFMGSTALGAQRWLRLGPISIQPSEIAKICIIIALAAWLAKKPIRNYGDIFMALFIVGIPAGLVFLQPDLGTTLVYGAITVGMLYWAGMSMDQLLDLSSPLITAILSSVGYKVFVYSHPVLSFSITIPVLIFFVALFLVVAYHYKAWQGPWRATSLFLLMNLNIAVMIVRPLLWGFLKDYQQQRLTIFLDPGSDPLGAGYHIIQSLYAVGGGGFFGRGFKAGELTQGQFVPEQHTDFIFSAIGEEFGFLGAAFVVFLYAVLCIRIIRIAKETKDRFNSLLLIGIFAMFLFHIFVNIGMNLSLMPITGVPLPFLSYGGTSLLVDLFLISLVAKVASLRRP